MNLQLYIHIQALLGKTDIMEEIEAGHTSSDGVYRDFCDGSFMKKHPVFSQECETLQLAFYFDELEVANPLGSKKGKHKLGNGRYIYSGVLNTHFIDHWVGKFCM